MSITGAYREARLHTPFADDELVLGRLTGREQLSTPFEYRLDCLSENAALALDGVLGASVTVEMDTESGNLRYLNGIVASVAHASREGEYAAYVLTLRPWLWLLSRTSDDRIFTDLSTPDIIATVFDDAGFSDYEFRLDGSYPPWHHRVQYRESAFAFVSRLAEHEGIYYHFRHELGRNVLVLCDNPSAHDTAPGHAQVPHFAGSSGERREREHLVDWRFERRVTSAHYAMNDFEFGDPRRDLEVTATEAVAGDYPALELYEYPAALPTRGDGKLERADGDALVHRRLEEMHAAQERAHGHGNVRALACGQRFSLTGCTREDQNREYLIVTADFEINMDAYFSGEGGGGAQFHVALECMDVNTTFRPPRLTPKPLIRGPQTAIVVGPAGEEIWTDSHARVKLQFHWDRHGKSDENSSCWVRVSQSWAGQGWGAMHVPRIGHEVIVEYVDGDPDRPIVTGRVYNGDNPVPHPLPASATQSGIKSRSSKGGSTANFNEIRMEDKKGSEELYVHAEKNQSNVVENDESTSVGHDRAESVGNDETISIGRDRTETVGSNETITIGSNRTEKVGFDEDVTIGGSRSVTVTRNKAETVMINKAETIGIAKELTIGGHYVVTVGRDVVEKYAANQDTKVSGGHTESIGKNQELTIGNDRKVTVGDDLVLSVGKNVRITAGESISIVTGKASISMKKDGTITIKGQDITVDGKGAINVKASKNIVMKGKKILQN